MKKIAMIIATAAVATAFTSMVAHADTFKTNDNKITFETPNSTWNQVTDNTTKISFSNGKDRVDVKEFNLNDQLPTPIVKAENFAEVYQTYYTTATNVYVLTGFASTPDSMNDVRSIIASMKLADHTAPAQTQNNGADKTTSKNTTDNKNTKPTYEDIADEIDYTSYAYYSDGTPLKLYHLKNGTILDPNGNQVIGAAEDAYRTSDGQFVYTYDPTSGSSSEIDDDYDDDDYYDTDDEGEISDDMNDYYEDDMEIQDWE